MWSVLSICSFYMSVVIHLTDAIEGNNTQKRDLYDCRGLAIPNSDGES